MSMKYTIYKPSQLPTKNRRVGIDENEEPINQDISNEGLIRQIRESHQSQRIKRKAKEERDALAKQAMDFEQSLINDMNNLSMEPEAKEPVVEPEAKEPVVEPEAKEPEPIPVVEPEPIPVVEPEPIPVVEPEAKEPEAKEPEAKEPEVNPLDLLPKHINSRMSTNIDIEKIKNYIKNPIKINRNKITNFRALFDQSIYAGFYCSIK